MKPVDTGDERCALFLMPSLSETDWQLYLVPLFTPFGPVGVHAWGETPAKAWNTAAILTHAAIANTYARLGLDPEVKP